MTSNMYTIHFEDLDWIFKAHERLGKEAHTWLMVRWLRGHDTWALLCLMMVGLYFKSSKSVLTMVLSQIEKETKQHNTNSNTTEGETNG